MKPLRSVTDYFSERFVMKPVKINSSGAHKAGFEPPFVEIKANTVLKLSLIIALQQLPWGY